MQGTYYVIDSETHPSVRVLLAFSHTCGKYIPAKGYDVDFYMPTQGLVDSSPLTTKYIAHAIEFPELRVIAVCQRLTEIDILTRKDSYGTLSYEVSATLLNVSGLDLDYAITLAVEKWNGSFENPRSKASIGEENRATTPRFLTFNVVHSHGGGP